MVQESETESIEFNWGKKRGVGGKKKDVQFYDSFTYDGEEYRLFDSVYMYSDGEPEPFIGKIIKIWETPDKMKKVKILWFFRPCEISNFLDGHATSENELFLASGEGVGLANVNPLEAIAGKCKVVCTSKDSRNPQPSTEECQQADFIFYRTFDVGRSVMSDKINDQIANVEVKLLLNKVNRQNSNAVLEFPLNKEVSKSDLTTDRTLVLSKDASEECETQKMNDSSIDVSADQKSDSEVLMSEHKTTFGQGSLIGQELPKMVKRDHGRENFSGERVSSKSKRKENAELLISSVNQEASLREKLASKFLPSEKDAFNFDRVRDEIKAGELPTITAVKAGEKLKSTKDLGKLGNWSSKKAQLDDTMEVHGERERKSWQKLHCDSSDGGSKTVNKTYTVSGDKFKRKLSKDSLGLENISSKKPKLGEQLTRLVDDKLPKPSNREASNDVSKAANQKIEVSKRPGADKSRWFKGLPWEERIPNAHNEGRLVLLQNLDPSFTSAEVEDIVWHAFKEYCSAKVIQRTTFSSPFSGQAFIILKTREAAENVVTKLDEGCLLLSNGRALIGSITNLSLEKQSIFFGHISIDKLRVQMQREMKEAVSTSHCSQPNTVEYDMAMEWCLLQEWTDLEWKQLYKQQGQELRKILATLKSK